MVSHIRSVRKRDIVDTFTHHFYVNGHGWVIEYINPPMGRVVNTHPLRSFSLVHTHIKPLLPKSSPYYKGETHLLYAALYAAQHTMPFLSLQHSPLYSLFPSPSLPTLMSPSSSCPPPYSLLLPHVSHLYPHIPIPKSYHTLPHATGFPPLSPCSQSPYSLPHPPTHTPPPLPHPPPTYPHPPLPHLPPTYTPILPFPSSPHPPHLSLPHLPLTHPISPFPISPTPTLMFQTPYSYSPFLSSSHPPPSPCLPPPTHSFPLPSPCSPLPCSPH